MVLESKVNLEVYKRIIIVHASLRDRSRTKKLKKSKKRQAPRDGASKVASIRRLIVVVGLSCSMVPEEGGIWKYINSIIIHVHVSHVIHDRLTLVAGRWSFYGTW
jgi:hypothetical protein